MSHGNNDKDLLAVDNALMNPSSPAARKGAGAPRRTSAEEIADLIHFMSSVTTLDDRATRSITVFSEGSPCGYLIPLSSKGGTDAGNHWTLHLRLHDLELSPICDFRIKLLGRNASIDIDGKTSEEQNALIDNALRAACEWTETYLDKSPEDVTVTGLDGRDAEGRLKRATAARPASRKILTAGPLIGAREAAYALDSTRYGWNENHSDYLKEFEGQFAAYVEARHAIATSSCTGALHLALLALGVGPGDEVIVPETTWVATGAAVRYVGAKPVFADVDKASWTVTVETVQKCLTRRTRVVMPVHLYGYPADMGTIVEFARENDLWVVEDAAPAIGALVRGRPVGSFGDMAAFSFQGAKMLVTGEGGMLVTSSDNLHKKAWKQQEHGRKPGTFWIEELGHKYKMSNLTAAIGLAQLQSAETQIAKKRRINQWYREFLADTPGIVFQRENPSTKSVCWMTSILLTADDRDAVGLATQLRRVGIDTRPIFPPISSYPIWGSRARNYPGLVAKAISAQGLNLPSGVNLSRASVERVAEAIDSFVNRGK